MPELIPEWRKAGRMLSVQCMALGVAIQGAYTSLPTEMVAVIPPAIIHFTTLTLFALGIIGRLVKQKKVRETKETSKAQP